MNETAIKTELHDRIEHADDKQIKELYGLMLNYFTENSHPDEWDTLSPYHQERITKSIEQADAGLGISADKVIIQARKKYGLNG